MKEEISILKDLVICCICSFVLPVDTLQKDLLTSACEVGMTTTFGLVKLYLKVVICFQLVEDTVGYEPDLYDEVQRDFLMICICLLRIQIYLV